MCDQSSSNMKDSFRFYWTLCWHHCAFLVYIQELTRTWSAEWVTDVLTAIHDRSPAGTMLAATLRCRHNGRDGIPNRRRLIYSLNRLFKRISKKTLKLRVSIWWRHHDYKFICWSLGTSNIINDNVSNSLDGWVLPNSTIPLLQRHWIYGNKTLELRNMYHSKEDWWPTFLVKI